MTEFSFGAELWRWPGPDPWRFVTVPAELSEEIRQLSGPRRGFGAVRVDVLVGDSSWRTSLFPEAKSGSYVLPIKRAVRAAEDLVDGDLVAVTLRLAPA